MDKITYFKIYDVAKSTALIVAILPLFLYEQMELDEAQIVLIAGYFFLLPVFLEMPFGIIADRYGNDRIIKIGLLFFLCAFLSLLFFKGAIAYYGYLLGIVVASTCFSGAEDGVLVAILPKGKSLFEAKSEIASFLYLTTTVLLMLGGIFYYLHPYLPLIMQAISIGIAIIVFYKLTQEMEDYKSKEDHDVINIIKISFYEILNLYRLSLLFLIAISSFAIVINNRVVSIQFLELLPFHPSIVISLMFIFGNMISSASNYFFKKHFAHYESPIVPLLFIGTIAIVSFLFMAMNNAYSLSIGFLLLCMFKAGYRAYLNATLVASLIKASSIATIFSFSSILTACVAFLLSALYANTFSDFQSANLLMAEVMAGSFLLSIGVMSWCKYDHFEIIQENSFSDKKHYIRRSHQAFVYGQTYPEPDCINPHIRSGNFAFTLYPTPQLKRIEACIVEWEYIRGSPLSLLESNSQIKIIQQLMQIWQNRQQNKIMLAHGDLHPDNIIVHQDGSFYVVDWDLCDETLSPEFDILTFLTSPQLHINPEQRLAFLSDALHVNQSTACAMAVQFIEQKIIHLSIVKGDFVLLLLSGYDKVKGEFHAQWQYHH